MIYGCQGTQTVMVDRDTQLGDHDYIYAIDQPVEEEMDTLDYVDPPWFLSAEEEKELDATNLSDEEIMVRELYKE